MALYYLEVLNPAIGLSISVLAQILSYKYIAKRGLLKSFLFGFFAGFLSIISLGLNTSIGILITNTISYAALGYCYFHFINLGETARRIRILREICDSREGLPMEEILKKYNAKEIVEKRINRLLNNNQIICKDEKYYTGSRTMLWMAKIIMAMKIILLQRNNEVN